MNLIIQSLCSTFFYLVLKKSVWLLYKIGDNLPSTHVVNLTQEKVDLFDACWTAHKGLVTMRT